MKYQVILADPPWEYKSDLHDGSASLNHYPSMKLTDMKLIKIPMDNNCVLFMWTTGPNVNMAIELGEAWGFQYKQVAFVWDKMRTLAGNYTITQCEFVLVFRPKRGKLPKRVKTNVRQFFQEKPREHSRKPKYVQDMIEQMFPNTVKIEMFARSTCEGWDSFGNETTKFD